VVPAGLFVVLLLDALYATAGLREGVEDIGQQLLAALPGDRRLTVAVTDFSDFQGATSDLSRYVAERLTTVFSQSGRVSVVERRRLTQVLAELGWSQSDLLDPAKAARVGQMAGVDAVIVGTVVALGAAVEIEGRLVSLATSQILAGATVTIPKDGTVEALMARGRQVPAAPAPAAPDPGQPDAPLGGPRLGMVLTHADLASPESYFLLSKAGAVWKYQVTVERQQGLIFKRTTTHQGTWIVTNEGEYLLGGQSAAKFRGTTAIPGADTIEQSYYYRYDTDHLLQVGEEHVLADGQVLTATNQPGIVLLRSPVGSGQQWETTVRSVMGRRPPRTLTVKVTIGSQEGVVVPAGTFQAVRVDIQAGQTEIAEWLAPGVGRVKRIMNQPGGRFEAVLFEYSIPQ